MDMLNLWMWFVPVGAIVLFLAGIRIVRPTHRGVIERLGRYDRFAESGFHRIIPVIERMFQENITEQMIDATPQEIITFDNLNARVDAQVYFKVKPAETPHGVEVRAPGHGNPAAGPATSQSPLNPK